MKTKMTMMFDADDLSLFEIDDKDLKAQAIFNSILPRLQCVVHETIAKIAKVYKLEPLDNATISSSPSRVKSRGEGFKVDFSFASSGLSPVRDSEKWKCLDSSCGQTRMILPMTFHIALNSGGASTSLCFTNRNLDAKFQRKVADFIESNFDKLIRLMYLVHGRILFLQDMKAVEVITEEDIVPKIVSSNSSRIVFLSRLMKLPIGSVQCAALSDYFVMMYPIFASICNLAIDGCDRFEELYQAAIAFSKVRFIDRPKHQEVESKVVEKDSKVALKHVDEKIRVMPGKRWQVFYRDGWKCVSCGRGAADGVILNVDHIVPRSKGGSDDLSNLQTLCFECNVGKSNKDDSDLRKNMI